MGSRSPGRRFPGGVAAARQGLAQRFASVQALLPRAKFRTLRVGWPARQRADEEVLSAFGFHYMAHSWQMGMVVRTTRVPRNSSTARAARTIRKRARVKGAGDAAKEEHGGEDDRQQHVIIRERRASRAAAIALAARSS